MSRWWGGLAGALIASILLAPSARGDDDGRRFALVFSLDPADFGCAPGAAITADVERRFDRRVWVEVDLADGVLEVSIEHSGAEPSRFAATIRMLDRSGRLLGERSFRPAAPGCAPLEQALDLILTLTVDPNAELAPPAAAPTVEAGRGEEAIVVVGEERPDPSSPPETAPPSRTGTDERANAEPNAGTDTIAPRVQALALGSTGRGPGLGYGVELAAVELGRSGLWVVDGAMWWPRLIAAPDVQGRIRLWQAELGAHFCPIRLTPGRHAFSICAGVRMGLTAANGLGFRSPNRDFGPEVDPAISLRGSVRASDRFGVALVLRAAVPLLRSTVEFVDSMGQSQTAFEAPSYRLTLGLGFELTPNSKKTSSTSTN